MVKFRTSPLTSDVRGTVAGVTYKLSRHGHIAYIRPPARRQRRITQTPHTANFARLIRRWKQTLTPLQRFGWTVAAIGKRIRAPAGPNFILPGLQLYLHCNIPRILIDMPDVDTAPAFPHTMTAHTLTPVWSHRNRFTMNWALQRLFAGDMAIVSISTPFSDSSTSPRFWYKQHWRTLGPFNGWKAYLIDAPWFPNSGCFVTIRLLRDDSFPSTPAPYRTTWSALPPL